MNDLEIRVQEEVQRLITSDPKQIILIAARAIEQSQQETQKAIREVTEQKDQAIAALMPKVDAYEQTMGIDKLTDMKIVAKTLNFKGMGRNNLFDYLRMKGVLDRWNKPYQRFVDSGYFKLVKESFRINGCDELYFKTVATQKGLEYIGKLLKGDDYVPVAR